ncbi:uncharacterized protein LOC100877022 isoform X1 [Megachile rotundata]|uniref:uncharacterized protein LOC100877022 isoform X1 n=2 Tax=Megachile rotundata TaxID=143995 RepID=UPI003FD5432C
MPKVRNPRAMVHRRSFKSYNKLIRVKELKFTRLLCFAKQVASKESWPLIIKSVNVPPIVKNGTDYVILDCDYDLENTPTKGLVVKWFYNTNEVAYQWIHGRQPLAGDTARKYIDLKYKASNDPYTEYRAMKLNKPDIDLTGEYTCVISTFADERSASASMVVFSTEKKFDLVQHKKIIDGKNGVKITCNAEGLYPEPTLDLSIEGRPLKQPVKVNTAQAFGSEYSISLEMELLDEQLPGAAIIKCLLGIPAANYSVFNEIVYYPGTNCTTTSRPQSPGLTEMEVLNSNFAGQLSINIFLIVMHLALVSMFM